MPHSKNTPQFISRIVCVRKALRREFEQQAGALDITASQFQVLKCLWAQDGISTSALSQVASSDGGTMTGVLDRLESKGLIRRERSKTDRRAVEIWLTPQGRELEAPLLKIVTDINQRALKGLTQKQQQELLNALEQVRENLDGKDE